MWVRVFILLLPSFIYPSNVFGASRCLEGYDFRSGTKNGGWLISDLRIIGTQSFSSHQLEEISSQLVGICTDESSEQVAEHLRYVFQNRGYFAVDVSNVEVNTGDPLSQPRLITVQAQVAEGPRYKLAGIHFMDHPAFADSTLQAAFPIRVGDVFARDKIASGLEELRKLYGKEGYLDVMFEPDTSLAGTGVLLSVTFTEGPQYHMGKLLTFGRQELVDRLRANWKISEGKVFDGSYRDSFIEANRTLLPVDFIPDNIQVVRNCPEASADVRIVLDPILAAATPATIKNCDASRPPSR